VSDNQLQLGEWFMKKTLVYMLVLCFGLCVIGCSGGEKKPAGTGTKTPASDTTKTPAEKPK